MKSLRIAALMAALLCLAAPPIWAEAPAGRTAALVAASRAQIGVTLGYDPSYRRIAFPMGDVPAATGVCSDVVVRALRALGIDLQREINADMAAHFAAYPKLWGLSRPDSNIDHRRVPNIATWLARQGKALKISSRAEDYRAGDIVTWMLPGGLAHIGIVSDRRSQDGARPLAIHNIGAGAAEQDILFAYTITGHYRMF